MIDQAVSTGSSLEKNPRPAVSRPLLSWYLWLLLSLPLVTACDDDGNEQFGLRKEKLRQNAVNFYKTLYSPSQAAVDSYVAATYVEHQISAGFTLAGLKAHARSRPAASTPGYLVIHRTLVQDNIVGLHIEERITADSSVARMSMLRFNEAGKIIDHWEAMQGQPRRRANPNTMFDGAAVRYISASGARSRDVLVAADLQAFNNYDTLIVRQTRALPYTQHNPTLPDGINAFIQFLMRLKNSGARIIRTGYQKVAEGDFIMTLSNSQTTADVIVFDLLRVNEDGKAVEHWDVLQPLNGADKSKVY